MLERTITIMRELSDRQTSDFLDLTDNLRLHGALLVSGIELVFDTEAQPMPHHSRVSGDAIR